MSWLEKLLPSAVRTSSTKKKGVPEGLWAKCKQCQSVLYKPELERDLDVCAKCGHHGRICARKRLELFLDPETDVEEIAGHLETIDFLKFKDSKKYKERITAAVKKSGENEAMLAWQGKLKGLDVVVCAMDFSFMGGSMGAVVGERFVQAARVCEKQRVPLVVFCASGGARMQEGLISLMQMAKTSMALARLRAAGLPYISVLTDPTTGGVSASFAMLGDLILAEPQALIGFAGPRVIEQIVRETLPEGFQSSEFLLEHGAIDLIVARKDLRETVHRLLLKLLRRKTSA